MDIIAVCVALAVILVFSVVSFVRAQNRRLHRRLDLTRANAYQWQTKAETTLHTALVAQEAARQAHDRQVHSARLASQAIAQTGNALEQAKAIHRVAGQMDQLAILSGQLGELIQLAQGEVVNEVPGRHTRHALAGSDEYQDDEYQEDDDGYQDP